MRDFCPILKEFNKEYFHGDLNLGNLVWDGSRLRMIDFAFMKSYDDKYNDINDQFKQGFIENDVAENNLDKTAHVFRSEIEFIVKSTDVMRMFSNIYEVLTSKYVKENLYKEFKWWVRLTNPDHFSTVEDIYDAIGNIPLE